MDALGVGGGGLYETAQKRYQEGRDRVRESLKAGEEQNPIASGAGSLTGAIATLPLMPEMSILNVPKVAGATLVGKTGNLLARSGAKAANSAAAGGAFGAVQGAGEGEGIQDTAEKALTGAAIGGVTGGVASPVLDALGTVGQGVVNKVRALNNPVQEGERRVAAAFGADYPTRPNMIDKAADVIEAGQREGQPLVLADTGGDVVRSLARSAADTSPDAKQALNVATGPRFQDQGERLSKEIQGIVGGNPDSTVGREQLVQEARRLNAGNYNKAYEAGDREIKSPVLEQLTSSPDVISAMHSAVNNWKAWQVADGFGGVNPGATIKNGLLKFNGGQTGVPVYPNIQFWDYVARDLADNARSARDAGKMQLAARYGKQEQMIKAELDKQVPEFQTARRGAAQAFGADDALTAGEEFATSRMSNSEARDAIARMNPAERELFTTGFASNLLKAMREVQLADRSTVAKRAFLTSPAARERIEMALGPQGARRLEMQVTLETLMEKTRAAVQGGSHTAEYLANAGLAGGGYSFATGDTDFSHIGAAAMTGALMKHGGKMIDTRVARRVGELLSSDDPEAIRQAVKMVSSSPKLMDAVRRTDGAMSRFAASSAPSITGPSAIAQDQQQESGAR